ncbi:MAG: transcription antitermination factor NusB [Anaerolineales bacterium]|nr:transcription antitermination factor NusB [Anaerolineales bacterium]
MKVRRKARATALQTLYELACTRHGTEDVLGERIVQAGLGEDAAAFTRTLVAGVLENARALDRQIARHAPEFPLDQMAVIDRAILRIALWEAGVARITPLKVAINEAVELAKDYGSDSAPRFINGVLGAVAPTLTTEEKAA